MPGHSKSQQQLFALRYSRDLNMEKFLSDEVAAFLAPVLISEQGSTTPPTVVAGLGYPNGRDSISPEPSGWQADTAEVTFIEKQVSRETSR